MPCPTCWSQQAIVEEARPNLLKEPLDLEQGQLLHSYSSLLKHSGMYRECTEFLKWEYPKWMVHDWTNTGKCIYEWMIWGTSTLGNLHIAWGWSILFTDKDGDVYIRVARLPRILHMWVLSQQQSLLRNVHRTPHSRSVLMCFIIPTCPSR